MRILITGANGFAGSNLCKYFSDRGYDVVATYRNHKPDPGIDGVSYIRQELSERIEIDGDIEAIIHTAVSKSGEEREVLEYIRDNIDTARSIVEFAKRKKVNTVFYFSTRSIYGEVREKQINENTDIINPDKYGQTKRIAEEVFQEAKDINTLGIRLPGIIGARAHDIWLVDLVNRIYREEDVEVSDFDTRNLVHIEDICRFAEKMIIQSNSKVPFRYNIVNLCCSETINNLEIANIIKTRLHSKSKIVPRKPGKGLFLLDPQRAYEMGYESMKPKEIVNKYLDWFISEL